MRITSNFFRLSEFERTTHSVDNTVKDINILANIQSLVSNVLDKVRSLYGKPIMINSGYRSQELNKLVGGSVTSEHLTGEAVDITVGSREENKKLFDMILQCGIVFNQLIDEQNYKWIHISYKRTGTNKKQVLHL